MTLTDTFTVRMVVGLLGVTVNIGLLGSIWLIHDNTDPVALTLIGSITTTALGGLIAMLVSTRSVPAPPPAVAVT